MNLSYSTGRLVKGATAAAVVTLSLGAATLATVEPAQAYGYRDGYHARHFGFHPGFRNYGYGIRHRGFAYRPFYRPAYRYAYRPVRHYGYGYRPVRYVRPFVAVRAPFFGYGVRHNVRHAFGHPGWHQRYVY